MTKRKQVFRNSSNTFLPEIAYLHKYSDHLLWESKLRSSAFPLIILEMFLQLDWSTPVEKFNWLDMIWKGTHQSISPTVDSSCQSKNQAMRSKELSVERRDRIVLKHNSEIEEVWNNQDSSKRFPPDQTEQSGEKGLGQVGDQEPNGHADRAPELLCGDGRTFL